MEVARHLGRLIDKAPRDACSRIRLNPILRKLEETLGSPCRLDRYMLQNRDTIVRKLASFYAMDPTTIVYTQTGSGGGTWYVIGALINCLPHGVIN